MPIQKGPANLGTGSVDSTELSNTLDLSAKTVTYRTIVAGDIASNAITTAKIADANITPAKMANSGAELSIRNRIINGAMTIDQRNAGASVTPTSAAYTLDRWQATMAQASKYSVQQVSDAPDGFTKSLKVTSLSAYSVGAGETFTIRQIIEGQNIADLAYGTASTKTVSISFWVKSSLTGSFGVVLGNGNVGRTYGNSYTISQANTWEYKTVTVPGDTVAFPTDNSQGLYLIFGLGISSTVSAAAGSWQGSFYYGVTGATSVVGTNGATWQITGVQLEKGSNATPFDYRQYGMELALCQRYYLILDNDTMLAGRQNGSTQVYATVPSPVPLRATPTPSFVGGVTLRLSTPSGYQASTSTTVSVGSTSTNKVYIMLVFNGFSVTDWYISNLQISGTLQLSAEL